MLAIASVVISLDQWTKAKILKTLSAEGDSMSILSWFDFTLIFNPAAAFGLMRNLPENIRTWVFFILPPAVLTILWFGYIRHFKKNELLGPIAMGLVIGGALGNYIDRFTVGKVVDFIDWFYLSGSGKCILLFYNRTPQSCHWPAFNIADSAISCAIFLLIVQQILTFKNQPKK